MLIEDFERTGCRWRAISVIHLDEIRNDVESLHSSGELDEVFYKESLTGFDYEVPAEMPEARSVIVASVPQPAIKVSFSWKGKNIKTTIPPTYGKGPEVNDHVKKLLEEAVKPIPHRFVKAALPLKTVAVRSGLASYGRCNVTFVPGMGSYHRLVAFFTNHPGLEDQWQERRSMARCNDCGACIKACPTGAITEDRFLIKAERCLAHLNEMPSHFPFPDWIEGRWHNCIVGCMNCQRTCPENKGRLSWSDGQVSFSEEETSYLMNGKFEGEEAKRMDDRLKRVGLDLSIFPRNLEVLVDRQ